MSEESIEVIRTAMDAWNRGDWDAALMDVAPDVEVDASTNRGGWRGVHRGRDWLRQSHAANRAVPGPGRDPDGNRHSLVLDDSRRRRTRIVTANELDDALEAAGLSG